MRFLTLAALTLLKLDFVFAALPACPSSANATYDYIVVGSGAGGGPVAARLAINGYKVLLIDAGHDVYNVNTTVPFYQARASEDPQMALDYEVSLYPPGQPVVKQWYPRSGNLGGSTVHNALVHLRAHNWDLDTLATRFNDPSWSATNMRRYLTEKIENNLYVPSILGRAMSYGYGGWLSLDFPPLNIYLALENLDTQLLDILSTIINTVTPVFLKDYNNDRSDNVEGGTAVILTKDAAHNRSSVRDHLVRTRAARPNNLIFQLDTMATKVLMCNDAGTPRAYGVEAASGGSLLPVARRFSGKTASLVTQRFVAKREIIVSAGVYQTPQLLMLSGIGDQAHLSSIGIETVSNVPGVGQNLQDRAEMTMVYKLKKNHVLFTECRFGDTIESDPCLKDWAENGHNNGYSSGAAVWAHAYRSSPNLPYLDMWSMWGQGAFRGYFKGWPVSLAMESGNSLTNVLLKGHTASKGWVRLTGSGPQDMLEINKNLYQTPAALNDLEVLKDGVKKSRALVAAKPGLNRNIVEEFYPGAHISTDDQIRTFLRQEAWGHHACCTAKMGTASDPLAVLDKDFKVRGVKNLRVVDISVFPDIPGFFVTTPIYQIAEKAADVIMQTARAT